MKKYKESNKVVNFIMTNVDKFYDTHDDGIMFSIEDKNYLYHIDDNNEIMFIFDQNPNDNGSYDNEILIESINQKEVIEFIKIKIVIDQYNDKLYNEGSYNSNMITTNEVFIKYYQDFLDNDKVEDGEFRDFIEKYIKEVKDSNELYVIDCLVLDGGVEKFSTIDQLHELMKEFNI